MSIIQWHEENFRRWILGKRLRLAKYTQPLISQTNRKDHLSLYHSVQESGIATVWGLQSIPKLLYTVQQCQYSVFAPGIYYTLPSTFKKKKMLLQALKMQKKRNEQEKCGKIHGLIASTGAKTSLSSPAHTAFWLKVIRWADTCNYPVLITCFIFLISQFYGKKQSLIKNVHAMLCLST